MLRTLLEAPEENGIIVDRRIRAGSDMMKCQMDGRRILQMGKQLTTDAAAEVVGPARFGAAGAALLSRSYRSWPREQTAGSGRARSRRSGNRPRVHRCRQPGMFLGGSRYCARQARGRAGPDPAGSRCLRDPRHEREPRPDRQSASTRCGRAPDSRELNVTTAASAAGRCCQSRSPLLYRVLPIGDKAQVLRGFFRKEKNVFLLNATNC